MTLKWEKVRLGDVAELQRGFDLPSTKRIEGEIPIVSSSGITGFHVEAKAKAPGVVTGRYGSIGDVFYLEQDFWPLNTSLWVKDFHGNDEKFIYFLLSNFDFKKFSDKTGVPGVNRNDLHAVNVLLPPLSEQKKIAQILSTWDKAISVTEKLLTNSQQQKKALMQQLLTGRKRLRDENGVRFSGEWKQVELGDVFEKVSNGLTYDANSLDGLPVTRIETISTGRVNFEKVGWAPDCDNTRRFKLNLGDILYSHINSLEHIGRVAYFNDDKPLYHGMNLLLLRTKMQNNSLFLFHLLNSQVGKKYAKTYAKSAVNQASISTTDIKTFKVFIPERLEQQKIASVLSAADAEISILEKKLACLKDEKKALMQQLLTGKRRVKVDEAVAV
ncbi:putative restriction-modification DNA specificity domain protein [Escherichia coli]|uniref:restriction endonuclease subunit S n=1 Tax=Escherichia coli TaxID=562 RepID=UPI000DA51D30|nr:restriction endonuclease subunit S [Escherichia coli]SQP98660.1 putative restriction-modification DNA specificity domain protein [Escherichia coli]